MALRERHLELGCTGGDVATPDDRWDSYDNRRAASDLNANLSGPTNASRVSPDRISRSFGP